MAVTPIQARCRRCGEDFHLTEVLDDRSGTCPRCGWSLTFDWTAKLLDDAADADILQRRFVNTLRRLHNLPGHVVLRPHTVLRNLFEEVGWQHDLAQHPDLLRQELQELRRLLTAWELLDPIVLAAQPRRSRVWRVIDWLTGRPPEPVLPIAAEHARLGGGDLDSEGTTDRKPPDRDVEDVLVGS